MSTQDPLAGTNLAYVEELYARYLANPKAVDADWRNYFAEWNGDGGLDADGLDADSARRAVDGPSLGPASIFRPVSAASASVAASPNRSARPADSI